MTRAQGFFITFEGGEGAGKSTQVQMLADAVRRSGRHVTLTREPGGTPQAEKIRGLLVNRDGGEWGEMEECLLLFAARLNHYRTLIEPSLTRGDIVICDRFTDSTRAYQGYGMGMELEKVEALKHLSLGAVEPDLTILLDIPASEGVARSARRLKDEVSQEDRYENMDLTFHERLRDGFLKLAAQMPERIKVLDARNEIDEIARSVYALVQEGLSLK